MMRKIALIFKDSIFEFFTKDVRTLSAALSFYTMSSVFPLALIFLGGLGYFFQYWDPTLDVEKYLLQIVSRNYSAQVSEVLGNVVGLMKAHAARATGLGILLFLYTVSGIFEQINNGLCQIWKLPEPSHAPLKTTDYIRQALRRKLRALMMVMLLGVLLALSIVLTIFGQHLDGPLHQIPYIGGKIGYWSSQFSPFLLNMLIFSFLFRYFSRPKISWKNVLAGALVTALLWEGIKRLTTFYLSRSSYWSAYNAIQAVLVVMLWVYLNAQILYFGACFAKVCGQQTKKHQKLKESRPNSSDG